MHDTAEEIVITEEKILKFETFFLSLHKLSNVLIDYVL